MSVLVLAIAQSAAWGHPVLRDSIEHRTQVRANADNIDVEIDLIFHEVPSRGQRRLMDADGNGRITFSECRAYVAAHQEAWRTAVTLSIENMPLELITLYDPEIDLMEQSATDRGQHRLKLMYFARMPANVRDNAMIELTDWLWPEVNRIFDLRVSGDDGLALQIDQAEGWSWNASAPGEPLQSRLVLAHASRRTDARQARVPSAITGTADRAKATYGHETGTQSGPIRMWMYALVLIAGVMGVAALGDRRRDSSPGDT